MRKSNYVILMLTVSVFVACSKTVEESIPEIVSIIGRNNLVSSDYKVSDSGNSSFYWVEHEGNKYLARMPIVLDTLLSLNLLPDSPTLEQNKGNNLTKQIPLHCEEAEEIREVCLLFRKIWKTNPKEIYLRSMHINHKKDVALFIESKTAKEYYRIEIEHDTHDVSCHKYRDTSGNKTNSNGDLISVIRYFNLYNYLKERASKTPDIRLGSFILMNARSVEKTVGNLMENLDYDADSSKVLFKNAAGELLELSYYHGDPDNVFRKFRVFQCNSGEAKNINMIFVTESGVRLGMTSEELWKTKRGCISSVIITVDGRKEYTIKVQQPSCLRSFNIQDYYARYFFNADGILVEFEFGVNGKN